VISDIQMDSGVMFQSDNEYRRRLTRGGFQRPESLLIVSADLVSGLCSSAPCCLDDAAEQGG